MKLSIITSTYNEAKRLEFWYKNHKDLADEFILYDTGSTDNTIEVSRELGIITIEGNWYHDFSLPKNQAIKFAKGDWILSLAPDYWIGKKAFKFIRKAIESDKYVGYFIPLEYHSDVWISDKYPITRELPKEKWHTGAHLSLFKNDPRIEYRHRVHENTHESIIEYFGEDKIGFCKALKHHDNTKGETQIREKLEYYQYLEDMSAIERRLWEAGSLLRQRAYKYKEE